MNLRRNHRPGVRRHETLDLNTSLLPTGRSSRDDDRIKRTPRRQRGDLPGRRVQFREETAPGPHFPARRKRQRARRERTIVR